MTLSTLTTSKTNKISETTKTKEQSFSQENLEYQKSLYVQGQKELYEVVIGLEVHAQVTAQSKLFSSSPTVFGSQSNSQVSFVDGAFPGMLPVLNKFCVDQAIRTGLGLNAQIHPCSTFERKHYFYPDLPQGYQISQYERPIVYDGSLTIVLPNGQTKNIRINRLHLEQDAGKSIHNSALHESYIDLNRSGIALMEIVSEPDISSADEAVSYLKKLRGLLRYLGTCDGNMEEGSLRADVNISIRPVGGPLGTRCEVKNLNSFRFLQQAVKYEVQRQIEVLERGESIIQQTRLFDSQKGETIFLREKEDAHEYRYFPDPDLPDVLITQEHIDAIRLKLPELPDAKRERFMESYGISAYDGDLIASDHDLSRFFEEALESMGNQQTQESGKLIANWLLGEFFAHLNRHNLKIHEAPISPKGLGQLILTIQSGLVSSSKAKEVFAEMWVCVQDPESIIKAKGWGQISDTNTLESFVQQVLTQNPEQVTSYRSGKVQLLGFFVGKVMALSKGQANPQLVNELLEKHLNP
jgi:aspartyl-tRNA(Asn)/glutamyl-tRNA(Gln) amidotransferase subunit B